MSLTETEKKLLEELRAKEGDPEDVKHERRIKWLDAQIDKEEKAAKDAKEADEKKKNRKI